jgi:uncharacterized membrane protein
LTDRNPLQRRLSIAVIVLFVVGTILPTAVHAHEEEERGVIGWLGSFHPVAVHFPIALVFVAALAEILYAVTHNGAYVVSVRLMLRTGAAFGVMATLLGFAAATMENYTGAEQSAFATHRVLGVASPILMILTLGLAESAWRTQARWRLTTYRVLLLATVIVVCVLGYLGGLLVFGADHFRP